MSDRNSPNSPELSRRDFLTVGGIAAVGAASTLQTANAQVSTALNQTPKAEIPVAPPAGPTKIAPPKIENRAIARPMPELQNPPALPPDQRIGFAIVGLGNYALNQILPSFGACKKAKLSALVSGDRDKASRIAAQYGLPNSGVYTYDTFDQIRDNADVKVIYIILPVGLHHAWTLRSLGLGKHVLCEKPMANTPAQCQEMIDAAKAANRQLMIGYRAQFEPFNLEAIRICRSGELGAMVSIISDHGRQANPNLPSDQWRLQRALAGGGPLFDVGIYALNATRYLTGEEPFEVQATQFTPPNDPRFREVEASIHWTMRFPSGVLSNCSSSYNYHETKRFRVQFERGWLDLDPATDYYKHRMTLEYPAPKSNEAKNVQEERQIPEGNQFAAMLDHMAESANQNKRPKTPGEEGLRDVRLMTQIYEAARTGQRIKVG